MDSNDAIVDAKTTSYDTRPEAAVQAGEQPSAHLAGATEQARIVFGVDLDGVCGDHEAAFRAAYSQMTGIPHEQLPPQSTFDAFTEWGLDPGTFEEAHRRAVVEHRIFETMPMMPGASEALWRLSDAGVWIRVITHRLVFSGTHDDVGGQTFRWLQGRHLDGPVVVDGVERAGLIPCKDVCFIGDKPDVGADLYVDDAPHNIVKLRAAGKTAIVFDQPYNRHLPGPRAHGWDDVHAIVTDHLDAASSQTRLPIDG